MAFSDNLPVSESLGVFVGISGFDWLTDGYAEPLQATIIALLAGGAVFTFRRFARSRQH